MDLKTIWTKRKEEAKARLEICSTCEKFEASTTRCQECGCFMIAKTLLPFSDCPLGKWKSYEEKEEEQQ